MLLLIPVGLLAQGRAHDRAVAAADIAAARVAGAISAKASESAVRRAVAATEHPDRITVRDASDPGAGRSSAKQVAAAAAAGRPATVEVADGLVRLVPVRAGSTATVIEVFVPADEADARAVWWTFVAGAILLMLAFGLLADRMATRLVRGIGALREGAVALGGGELTARVAADGCRELVEAGAAFNRMADRIVQSRTSERELVADLSHRLRTPLTVLRLDAESLVGGGDVESNGALDTGELFMGSPEEADHRRTIRRIRTAVAALEKEIDVLIRTTRQVVSTQESDGQICDASEVVRERMEFWSAVASDQNRPFTILGTQRRAPVPLPRAELAAALDAVLGNVFRYTPQGTPFEVGVSRRDGYVGVRVDDGGAGIPDPDRALRRGASDQGSTGLGLDIARRATLAAHGSVSIDRARLGGASVVMLFGDAEDAPEPASRFGLVGRQTNEPQQRRWPRPRQDNE